MKQVGEFIEARSFWCPNCGTHLGLLQQGEVWVLHHDEKPGQEFCPNWGKSFEAPTITLKEAS